ncbi:MAG TPA: efflux transporter outer membrane subunit [Limnobacter sp.]|uniref:efflux transporter outer membrane subunit n=1 Tax=Limnobacter sp. TaxID=2003368 RepID=UPI002EDAD415
MIALSKRVAHWCVPVVLLPLSACSLAPTYTTPALNTPVPAEFKQDGPWRPTAGQVQYRADWWVVFNDPVLNQLEEQLTQNNPGIAIAQAQYRSARAALDGARASLFPTLNGNLGATRSRNGNTGNTTVMQSPVTNLYTLSAQAAWEVDLWGKLSGGVDAADARAQSAEALVGSARVSAQALLAQSYFLWRASMEQEALLQRSVEAYTRFRTLTQNRLNAGVASKLDLAQADTLLNNTRTQLSEATLSRVQTENAIAVLLGIAPAALALNPSGDWSIEQAAIPATPALLPSELLLSRFDVYSAERQVAAANAQIGVARAAYFPSLNLSASTGFRSNSWSNLTTSPGRFWSVGPALALNLFDAGARSAQVEQARATYDQTAATYRQTVLSAFQEVEDNLAAIRYLAEERESQMQALQSARLAREVAENQYKAGTADALTVISAQVAELNAETARINLWNRSVAAVVQLLKNTGGRAVER